MKKIFNLYTLVIILFCALPFLSFFIPEKQYIYSIECVQDQILIYESVSKQEPKISGSEIIFIDLKGIEVKLHNPHTICTVVRHKVDLSKEQVAPQGCKQISERLIECNMTPISNRE